MKNPFRVTLTQNKTQQKKKKRECRTRKHRIHHQPHPLRRPPALLRPSFSGVVLLRRRSSPSAVVLHRWCKLLKARIKFLSIVGGRGCKLIFGSSQCMLMMILLVTEGANAASALIYFESSLHLLDSFKHQSRRNLR
ncbi:hypothetical protein Hanom_Chr04g00385241 [Helianthus anomalus]